MPINIYRILFFNCRRNALLGTGSLDFFDLAIESLIVKDFNLIAF
jgi:hypothetical protein